MLACRKPPADGAHAVFAADELEAVDRDVIGIFEVETGLPPGAATGHLHADRLVLITLGVKDDGIVIGAAVLLRELEAALVAAGKEIDPGAGPRLRHRVL